MHGPNNDDPQLHRNLQSKIESLGSSSLIIGGDWNVLLNYSRETINYLHQNNEKSHKQIHLMIEQLDLIDTYRVWHPHMNRYTWRGPRQKQARLDYCLTSSNLPTLILESDIGVAHRSDHSPVYLHVRDKGTWKFNNFLLRNEEYMKIVKDCISERINQYKIEDNENILEVQFSIDVQLF
jgi:hypothetical protein